MNPQTTKRTKSEYLDQEFRKILCVIREHIPYINSNAYLMQCRVWLEKLSSPNINKALRNLYLVELCGQIQKNKLLPPFNEAPPTGSLKSLTKMLLNRKSFRLCQDLQCTKSKQKSLQRSSETNTEERNTATDSSHETMLLCPHNTENWDYVNILKLDKVCSVSEPGQKTKCEQQGPLQTEGQNSSMAKFNCQNTEKLQNKTLECGEPATNMQNDNETETDLKNELKEIVTEKDEDSWSDLTELSSDAENESRKENKELKTRIIKIKKHISENLDKGINFIYNKIQTGSTKLELSDSDFENFGSEFPIGPYCEMGESNLRVPKDTNYISEDWKNTIDALQLRLSEMTQQNNELKVVIQKLETEIKDIRNKNKEETDQTIKMLENLHFEEIARLKENHVDKILQLEKQFQANMVKSENGHQEKINKVIVNCDKKKLELSQEKEDIIKRRDDEICRLTEVIQQQCTRITNDISSLQNQVSGCSCDKKLLLLKKCVSKMDKLFQRAEKEHLRQIDSLRQELDIKNTALQIQLKMQKAELIAETSSERQEEFEKILNSLEVKYIKMLEMHENQIMEMKKQDDEKIQVLKELLSQHGISYDEHYM